MLIEASEKIEVKDLPALKPMNDTLNDYCDENILSYEMCKDKVMKLLGGIHSPYYDMVKNAAKTLILGAKKKRCLLWTGVSDSGKSTVAGYIG